MPKKKSRQQTVDSRQQKSRKIKQPVYKSFRVSKRIHQPKPPLKGSFRRTGDATKLLLKNWRLFGGIAAVYLVLTIVLVKGFGENGNITHLSSLALFGVLLSNASNASTAAAGIYQSILLIITSLAIIWALRQKLAAKPAKATVRDAFYKGMYPLVPFLLVLLVISLQLTPLVIANFLYSLVFGGGLAVTLLEKALWAVLLVLLVVLSIYMVSSSVFALYIVTLPDVRPIQALRSARELVRHRRFMIIRKLLFLPVALIVVAAVIIVPMIILSPVIAERLFFSMSMLALVASHTYLYGIYRELL